MTHSIKTLLIANAAGFLLLRLLTACGVAALPFMGMEWPWPCAWTPLTYMLTHGALLELLFNMLWLWLFGRIFMMVGTDRRLLAAYFCGGLGGAAAFALGGWLGAVGHGAVLLGASASIIGMAVCAAVLAPSMGIHLLLIGRVSLRAIALITLALSLLTLASGNVGGALAHVGGALGGLAAGYAMRRGWLPRFSRKMLIRKTQAKTLDQLLDKVRRSGYASLSRTERQRLIELSKQIK